MSDNDTNRLEVLENKDPKTPEEQKEYEALVAKRGA